MPTILVPYSQSPSGANEMIGRGIVLIDPLDPITGLRSGNLRHIGNIEKLEISDKVEVKDKYESMDPQGNLYARAVTRQTVTIKITGDEITAENVAASFNGVLSRETVAGTSVAGETITPSAGVVLGSYYQLGQKNVDPTTVILDSGTAGTDYIVSDPVGGLVYIPPSSTIVAGTVLSASYTSLGYTFNKVNMAAKPSFDAYVAFYGNPVKGRTFHHEYWDVQFTPTGKQDWISDNFASYELEGQVIADTINHPLEPIGIVRQVA